MLIITRNDVPLYAKHRAVPAVEPIQVRQLDSGQIAEWGWGTMMAYLLGFPTPVVEIIMLLAGTVVVLALYYGLTFETVERRDRRIDGSDGERRIDDGNDRTSGDEMDSEVTG